MLPAPSLFKICSECSGLIEERQIRSGNTFGATFWTDGKRDAPMLPDQPWLVKCPHCQSLLWIDELEVVAEVDPFSKGKAHKDAQAYCTPELNDYYSILESIKIDKEKEHYIRLRAWWAGNDKRRDTKIKQDFSEKEIENLQSLNNLLDDSNDNDRLMHAEIKRELGEFEEAESILSDPFNEEFAKAVNNISGLVQERKSFVAKMNFD